MDKPKTVWKVLPVFYRDSDDTSGHSKAMFVSLPKGYQQDMLEHELFHVKQWYATFLPTLALSLALAFTVAVWVAIIPMIIRELVNGTAYMKTKRETAAYGESLRIVESTYGVDTAVRKLGRCAVLLEEKFGVNSYDELVDMMKARWKDGRLF